MLTLVAFGGTGKSALVAHWMGGMAADHWRGARRVLEWSFYSQGTEERVTSADRFLDHALGWFGDPDPKAGAPRDRGLRLAELVRREKTLLVLDGIEPLQHPPTSPLAGRLKDPGLAALLKSLAGDNPGLCVVTTRERLADLNSSAPTAPQESLEALSPEAGAELLERLGVKGSKKELLAASGELGHHALALTLLGGYLSRACGGDVRRRKDVDVAGAAERQGGHALRVIEAYARWLGEGPELAALRLLGLFDRPADPNALAALRGKPAIPGLTEALVNLGEQDWQHALSSLREHGLLLLADPHQPGTLDAHPLVRVYFQEDLEQHRPEAWQAGNLRLYEHLQGEAPDRPGTLEAMEPLFTAVVHGCRAGRQQEALDEVYWRRIRRGAEFFSTKKLGAFGSDLAALSGFFDRCWDQPSARLTPADQAFVLNAAGFDLRALGRLAEAVQPMEAGLKADLGREDWKNAAISAGNLSELTLTLGEVNRSVAFGKQSVDLADRSGDAFQRMSQRTKLADGLHQAGRWEESAEAFREAEALQAERQPAYPRLYSLGGYRYCDLLLSLGEPESGSVLDGLAADPASSRRFREACREVRERAEQTLEWATAVAQDMLSIALDHLSLGRSHLGLALTGEEAEAGFAQAAEHLDHAVEGLRRAGNEDDPLPVPRARPPRARGEREVGDDRNGGAVEDRRRVAGTCFGGSSGARHRILAVPPRLRGKVARGRLSGASRAYCGKRSTRSRVMLKKRKLLRFAWRCSLARSSPMTDLYTRLQDVGFPRAYVRDRILPDWWEDELARDPGNRRIAEMIISRTLKISLRSLVDPKAALSLEGARAVRFKHWQDADEVGLLPAVALARRIFELLLSCAKTLPSCRLEGYDPKELRERILAQSQYVTLGALLRRCWDLGVPVVHLGSLPQGAKRVDGMAFMVGGRPCIALASSKRSPAWLIWHLAHEMGHVARGHLETGAALDEKIDFKAQDREEREANTFGKSLIYGGTTIFKAGRHITGLNLAAQARSLGPAHRIWPPCIVTSYGFNMDAWGAAQNALASLNVADGGPEEIRRELAQRVDLDQLSETDRCFFVRATGFPE